MKSGNLSKYLYFLILIILVLGYYIITKQHLNHKYTMMFYIRFSIIVYLFYILSDSILYTLLFSVFIFIAINIHYRNKEIEHFNDNNKTKKKKNSEKKSIKKNKDTYSDNQERLIELNNNRKTMETFFEYSNKLLENKDTINNFKNEFNEDREKYRNITNKIDQFQKKIQENLEK
tara:strand:- start:1630 stop:2154 length:525 start_codon:yes stop_codon:yes gene_type:complete